MRRNLIALAIGLNVFCNASAQFIPLETRDPFVQEYNMRMLALDRKLDYYDSTERHFTFRNKIGNSVDARYEPEWQELQDSIRVTKHEYDSLGSLYSKMDDRSIAANRMYADSQKPKRATDSALRSYYDKLNQPRRGTGNGTFSTNITSLQQFFLQSRTVKRFESGLADWTMLVGRNIVKMDYNDRTHKHDIPVFTVLYLNSTKSRSEVITVNYGTDDLIRSITFELKEDKLAVDKLGNYVRQLKATGYEFDLASTRLAEALGAYRRVYCKNPANKISVVIVPGYRKSSITVFKSK